MQSVYRPVCPIPSELVQRLDPALDHWAQEYDQLDSFSKDLGDFSRPGQYCPGSLGLEIHAVGAAIQALHPRPIGGWCYRIEKGLGGRGPWHRDDTRISICSIGPATTDVFVGRTSSNPFFEPREAQVRHADEAWLIDVLPSDHHCRGAAHDLTAIRQVFIFFHAPKVSAKMRTL